ncbi:SDR family oxidoreductase [Roseiflexus castenholzii]|jgi:NAD(P)-dependent dehydrogenase (short-subunit alcohol dehydrogenase family)|uniref:Short-chain dehydrogenase/reductase SDR n=1 Tax=Roseiflexus castenholzii (strain DSM 13941 / HLO8) TaxID=383372 RepID=A7NQ81_ROSCS|nr:SDR family oxidoreductase [Roseiflexus castenholzii]ABU59727.1 short-chain dehydrogenase/reductase SDR [Roseiflexus castenholzii DSM 13941]
MAHTPVSLVTGATSGIGEVTARELARRGMHVVIVGRNRERTAATVARIKQATGVDVEPLIADLSSQAGVRSVAEAFAQRHTRLDVLVNNAGGFFASRQVSADGIEMTWALNHMSYFLLTNLLLDTLRASAPARVVNVSSDAHRNGRMRWDDLQFSRGYNGWAAYAQSKLANILFSNELARRLEGSGVTSNALHPGFVATRFAHNNGALWGGLMALMQRLWAISPEEGAQTSIYLATAPEVATVSGRYFVKSRATSPAPQAQDMDAAARLWEISERMLVNSAPVPQGGAHSPA